MTTFKCKMCGGALENISPDMRVGTCSHCGSTMTLPRLDSERKQNLYDRAGHLRRANDFDKAEAIYGLILSEDPGDAEAYWSLVLCRYGVEYVEDPKTHKRVMTCHRTQKTPVFADSASRAVYEQEAATLDAIQKGILAISEREQPYDVFICYKESDAAGRRTPDSVLAQELYYELVEEGFNVFFSRITLEDKLGVEYEPYIYAALNSARVMVAVGTRPENLNAVWVKNEWGRYLRLINSGADKVLIPAYRDMNPYDLPEEFSHLQAQDMAKLGFMQDLVRGIKKILEGGEAEGDRRMLEKDVDGVPHAVRVAGLLNRALLFMEDGDFAGADTLVEQALNINPYSARAYLYKLMAELKVPQEHDLPGKADRPLEEYVNFNRALRFADEAGTERLRQLETLTLDALHARQKDAAYQRAVKELEKRENLEDIVRLQAFFKSLESYQQAPAMALKAQQKAVWARQRLEDQKLAAQQREARQKRNSILIVIAIVAGILAVGFLVVAGWVSARAENNRLFEQAVAAMEAGDYEQAQQLLNQVEHHTGIIDTQNEITYRRAAQMLEQGDHAEAAEMFAGLEGYSDSNIRRREAIYAQAAALYEDGEYSEAAALFESIENYSDSAERKNEALYAHGIQLYQSGEFRKEEGYYILRQLGSYKNTDEMLLKDACVHFFGNTPYIGMVDLGIWDSQRPTIDAASRDVIWETVPEQIKWDTVYMEGGKALLLSSYIYLRQPLYENEEDTQWENSSLREYLNGEFYDTAFNELEKGIILETEVPSAQNEQYGTTSGPATQDRLFILSAEELAEYVTDEEDWATFSLYPASQDYRVSEYKDTWWLRTPGAASGSNAYVDVSGQIVWDGVSAQAGVAEEIPGVRMAMWVDVNAMPRYTDEEAA